MMSAVDYHDAVDDYMADGSDGRSEPFALISGAATGSGRGLADPFQADNRAGLSGKSTVGTQPLNPPLECSLCSIHALRVPQNCADPRNGTS